MDRLHVQLHNGLYGTVMTMTPDKNTMLRSKRC